MAGRRRRDCRAA